MPLHRISRDRESASGQLRRDGADGCDAENSSCRAPRLRRRRRARRAAAAPAGDGRRGISPRRRRGMVERGALKVLLDESDLPSFEPLQEIIETAHRDGRSAAVHCVTRSELVLAAAAFAAAGCRPGDRIEHASVAPPDAVQLLADLPLTVVTQPGFIRERGDAYLVDVEPRDRPWLYRLRATATRRGATRRQHRRALRRSGPLDGDARGGRSPDRSRGHHRLRRGAHARASPRPVHLAPRATGRGRRDRSR